MNCTISDIARTLTTVDEEIVRQQQEVAEIDRQIALLLKQRSALITRQCVFRALSNALLNSANESVAICKTVCYSL